MTAGMVSLFPEGASHQGPPRLVRMLQSLEIAAALITLLRRRPIS